jgi:ribosomal protein L11 methyltransferase
VLDVGAGSGILAIAAVKLWPAATVVAVDNDPIAVAACAENAGVNAVGDRIASAATPVGDVDGQFDLVLANIQAHVLRELLPGIAPRVAPGGTLVMSGLLSPQAEAVAEDYAAVGFTVEAIRPSAADPAWSSAVLRRPS